MDVQQYVQLLNESNKSSVASNGTLDLSNAGTADEVARWWAAVISLAAYWLTGDDEAAHRLYPTVDALPKQLYNNE